MKPHITHHDIAYFGTHGSLHIFGTAEAIRDINQYIATHWGGPLHLTPEQENEMLHEAVGGRV